MKIIQIIGMAALLMAMSKAEASPGCMDTRQRGYWGLLRSIDCSCPCEPYPQSEFGACSRCSHYRKPTEYS